MIVHYGILYPALLRSKFYVRETSVININSIGFSHWVSDCFISSLVSNGGGYTISVD
jgi:hypothetical protein